MKILRFIIKACLRFVFFFAILVVIVYFMQARLLFHPTPPIDPPQSFGLLDFSEVKLTTADNIEVTGWFHKSAKPAKTILFFYGNADSLYYYPAFFKKLDNQGFNVLAMNYPGYGTSKGKPDEQNIYNTAKAAVQFLQQSGLKPETVIVVGRSLGTGVVTEIAVDYDIGGLVLVSPYTSMINIASEIYWYLPVKYISNYKFDSINKIGRVKAPVLIIHGADDKFIRPAHAEALYAAAKSRKEIKLYENSDHLRISFDRVADDIFNFMGGAK